MNSRLHTCTHKRNQTWREGSKPGLYIKGQIPPAPCQLLFAWLFYNRHYLSWIIYVLNFASCISSGRLKVSLSWTSNFHDRYYYYIYSHMPRNCSVSSCIRYQFSLWIRSKHNLWAVVSWPKSPSTTERLIIIRVIFRDFTWASSHILS